MKRLFFVSAIFFFVGSSWAAQHRQLVSFEQFKNLKYGVHAMNMLQVGEKKMPVQQFAFNMHAYLALPKNLQIENRKKCFALIENALTQYPLNPFLLHLGADVLPSSRKEECLDMLLKYQDPVACHWYGIKELQSDSAMRRSNAVTLLKKTAEPQVVGIVEKNRSQTELVYQHRPVKELFERYFHLLCLRTCGTQMGVKEKFEAIKKLVNQWPLLDTKDQAIVLFSNLAQQAFSTGDNTAIEMIQGSAERKKLLELAPDDELLKLADALLDNQPEKIAAFFLAGGNQREKECALGIYTEAIKIEKNHEKQAALVEQFLANVASNKGTPFWQQLTWIEPQIKKEWAESLPAFFTYAAFLIEHDHLGKAPGSLKAHGLELMRSVADRFASAAWYLADDCLARKKITPELKKQADAYFQEAQKLTAGNERGLLACVQEKMLCVQKQMNKNMPVKNDENNNAKRNDSLVDITSRKSELEKASDESQDQLAIDCLEIVESKNYSVEKKQEALESLQKLGDQKNLRALCSLGYAQLLDEVDAGKITKAVEFLAQALELPCEKKDEAIRELLYAELVARAKEFPVVCPVAATYQIPRVRKVLESKKADADAFCTSILELHSFINDARKAALECSQQAKEIDEITNQAIEQLFERGKIAQALHLMKSHWFISKGQPAESEMTYRLALHWLRFAHTEKGLSQKAITLLDTLARKGDRRALKEMTIGTIHANFEYEKVLMPLCKRLCESEPLLTLQVMDYAFEDRAIDWGEFELMHENHKDEAIIKWLCQVVKSEQRKKAEALAAPSLQGYEYLLPYQAADLVSLDEPIERDYKNALLLITDFLEYLNKKKTVHDDQHRLAIIRALKVLEQIQPVCQTVQDLKDPAPVKFRLLAHCVRDYDPHGSTAARIKKRVLDECKLEALPIDYSAYWQYGGYVDIDFYLARVGELFFARDLNTLKNLDAKAVQKQHQASQVASSCFKDMVDLFFAFRVHLTEDVQAKLVEKVNDSARDFVQSAIRLEEKVEALKTIVKKYPDWSFFVELLVIHCEQKNSHDWAKNIYTWYAKNTRSGELAWELGRAMMSGRSLKVGDVSLTYGLNHQEGLNLVHVAAEKKHIKAMIQLSRWYFNGMNECKRDAKKAYDWLKAVGAVGSFYEEDMYHYGMVHYANQEYAGAVQGFLRVPKKDRIDWLISRVLLFDIGKKQQGNVSWPDATRYLMSFYESLLEIYGDLEGEAKHKIVYYLKNYGLEKTITDHTKDVSKTSLPVVLEQLKNDMAEKGTELKDFLTLPQLWYWIGALHHYCKWKLEPIDKNDFTNAQRYLNHLKEVKHEKIRTKVYLLLCKLQEQTVRSWQVNDLGAELEKLYELVNEFAEKGSPEIIKNSKDIRNFGMLYCAGYCYLKKNEKIDEKDCTQKIAKMKSLLVKKEILQEKIDIETFFAAEFFLMAQSLNAEFGIVPS